MYGLVGFPPAGEAWHSLQVLRSLAEYTSPALMVPQVRGSMAADVIAELVDLLDQTGHLNDRAAFLDALMVRERLSPTCYSSGLALPHARLHGLPQLSFALARSSQPLNWFGGQIPSVQLVMLFAVPEDETKAYLNLIASVAKLSKNSSLLEQLLRASDARMMFSVLQQIPLRPVQPPRLATAPP